LIHWETTNLCAEFVQKNKIVITKLGYGASREIISTSTERGLPKAYYFHRNRRDLQAIRLEAVLIVENLRIAPAM